MWMVTAYVHHDDEGQTIVHEQTAETKEEAERKGRVWASQGLEILTEGELPVLTIYPVGSVIRVEVHQILR